MSESAEQLRRDAIQIWRAGVEGVRSDDLVRRAVALDGHLLQLAGGEPIDLNSVRRIVVVGGGKAGAGMAEGLESAIGGEILKEKQTVGHVNVPDDCARDLQFIDLHGCRPAGVNEPTEAAVAHTRGMLRLVESLTPDDLCVCLISGGGSALVCDPVEGVTLEDKIAVTRHLSAAGADIRELNTVRKHLSRVKGGGLARACRAGRLVTLTISDVLGDPLDLIASGPTVADESTPADALEILEWYDSRAAGIRTEVFDILRNAPPRTCDPFTAHVQNIVIGNNATAMGAAVAEARRIGYRTAGIAWSEEVGTAEHHGVMLGDWAMQMRRGETGSFFSGGNCVIVGGEPTVQLVDASVRGKGGRNQQLALAAVERLGDAQGIALLSGGTDGEDGPTDAAGAVVDADVVAEAARRGMKAEEYLRRNDAYNFFDPLGALIKTGPTHTNVCDLRVLVVEETSQSAVPANPTTIDRLEATRRRSIDEPP